MRQIDSHVLDRTGLSHPEHEEARTTDAGAPLSAFSDAGAFWDHLGATRAEEYALEAILPNMTLPEISGAEHKGKSDWPDLTAPALNADGQLGSLEDTLRSIDQQESFETELHTSFSDTIRREPVTTGLELVEEHLPKTAPYVAHFETPHGLSTRPPRQISKGRLAYKLQRIWLTPTYRVMLKFGLPLILVAILVAAFLADETRRDALYAQYIMIYDAIVDRPEFLVTELQLPEMSSELAKTVHQKLDIDLPKSSFRLDLDALRLEVESLDWVRSADLRLLSGGVLALSVTERIPAVFWRSDIGLELLDTEGVRVAYVLNRGLRPDLPLIMGKGADAHVAEALALLDAAQPLGDRLRGLVRMGERRWDIVLDRDQRIKLPERGALAALERILALDQAQDLLARDLLVADMRIPARPVLQVSAGAMETLRDIRSQSMEAMQ